MPEFIDCEEHTGPGPRGNPTCSICLKQVEQSTGTATQRTCNHTFCRECLSRWVEQKKKGASVTSPVDRFIIGIGENDEGADKEEEDEEEVNDACYYEENNEDEARYFEENCGEEVDDPDGDSNLSSVDEASVARSIDSNGDHAMLDWIETGPIGLAIQHEETQRDSQVAHEANPEDEEPQRRLRQHSHPLPSASAQVQNVAYQEPGHRLIRHLVRVIHLIRATAGYMPNPPGPGTKYGLPSAMFDNVILAILDDCWGAPMY